ncbi:MAG: hypothetical protein JSU87_03960 [Gemmatimonadota bacterium]|nr:MAG: hypothetical protein JSU87_03960 [Gemmatimonadota bacterium]
MKARLWAVGLALLFGAVLIWYLYYTQQLVRALNADAAAFSRMYDLVFEGLSESDSESSEAALFDMVLELERLGVPAVVTAVDGRPVYFMNLPFVPDPSNAGDVQRVLEYVEFLDSRNPPITTEDGGKIHFGMPPVVERLRWVPWIQAATLIVIVLTAIWIFRSTARAERERVWATMARESAHQLGTPISSLSGWVEILRMQSGERAGVASDEMIAHEVEVDVERLNKVAQRFELIGRRPKMQLVDLGDVLQRLEGYFAARLPRMDRSIELYVQVTPGLPPVAGNPVLLEWAFENIVKNAVDVLAGRGGTIAVNAEPQEGARKVRVRFVDDGPGVPSDLRKHIFEPGVSGKKDGWGVGLSLARRIIANTHGGSIQLGKRRVGAEFVVDLPAARPERTG